MKKNANLKAILITLVLFLVLITVEKTVFARAPNDNYDDNYEENDVYTSAYDFSAFENTWLSTINGYGVQLDDDWYEIYLDPEYRRLIVYCSCSGGITELGLYDKNCTFIQSYTYYGPSNYSHQLYLNLPHPSSGTYYIKVSGNNIGNEYDLKWFEDEESPLKIPGYNIILLLGLACIISIISVKRIKKFGMIK